MRRRELKYKCMDMDAWTITVHTDFGQNGIPRMVQNSN